jgi:hypothetical protein
VDETLAILRALARAVRRDVDTFLLVAHNNLFLFAAVLIYGAIAGGMMIRGGRIALDSVPFLTVLAVPLFFPLASDPLAQAPQSRIVLFPLTRPQRLLLRLGSLALSPILWIAILLLALTRSGSLCVAFVSAGLIAYAVTQVATRVSGRIRVRLSELPGSFGSLFRKDLLQLFSLLDFYAGFLIALATVSYRFAARSATPDAMPVMAVMIGFALSTCAQTPFALDRENGRTRYRLLQVHPAKILLSKDAAFLACTLLLTGVVSPLPGLTFAFIALSIGRYPAVRLRLPAQEWRFSSGDFRFGIAQMMGGTAMAMAEYRVGIQFFLGALAIWLISIVWGAWLWECHWRDEASSSSPRN